jgi:cyanophycinase
MKKEKDENCAVPRGTLLLIGGKEEKTTGSDLDKPGVSDPGPEVLKNFAALLKNKAVVQVITTAGEEDVVGTYREYKKVFKHLGIEDVEHMHHNARSEVTSENLRDIIRQSDAFFFAGGDQLRLTSIYGGTDFIEQLKERYIKDSIVVAGTSAGAMAMSTPMIFAGNGKAEQIAGEIKITTGLEFVKDVCIDTHFVHRGRFVRMAQVIATNPSSIGIGIEEDTAIIVRNGVDVEVIGTGTIIIIEGFSISCSNITNYAKNVPISIKDLKVHVLSRGDNYRIPQYNPPHH